jgi:hypothetical protein
MDQGAGYQVLTSRTLYLNTGCTHSQLYQFLTILNGILPWAGVLGQQRNKKYTKILKRYRGKNVQSTTGRTTALPKSPGVCRIVTVFSVN